MSNKASDNAHDDVAENSVKKDKPKPKPKRIRRILLTLGPLVVLSVIAYGYFTGARFVETENAYVKASKALISAEVSGPVAFVAVSENQSVNAGETLFKVDDKPYKIALAREEANLKQTLNDVKALQASYRAKKADLKLAEADAKYYEHELKRQQHLSKQKMVADSVLDEATHQRNVANLKVIAIRQEMDQLVAALDGAPDLPAAQHASVQKAEADRDNAALNLEHTVVKAAIAGITHNVPLLGDYIRAGSPVMNVISTQHVWIEANFKETQLTHVRDGQPVAIEIDSFPGKTWHGKVLSISQGTGSEFSVLPPQNATGNWVKVVQRVPVRVVFNTSELNPDIRAGMSTNIEIDTGYKRTLSGTVHKLKHWIASLVKPPVAEASTIK